MHCYWVSSRLRNKDLAQTPFILVDGTRAAPAIFFTIYLFLFFLNVFFCCFFLGRLLQSNFAPYDTGLHGKRPLYLRVQTNKHHPVEGGVGRRSLCFSWLHSRHQNYSIFWIQMCVGGGGVKFYCSLLDGHPRARTTRNVPSSRASLPFLFNLLNVQF